MGIERLKFAWNSVEFSAVAIGRVTEHPHNTHAGIIYKESDGKLYMLHLAWNHDLRRNAYNDRYACVTPKLRPERARSIAAFCRLLWNRQRENQTIPFALRLCKEVKFDSVSGKLLLSKGAYGLNCSNFTIIVYLQFGVELIALDTWQSREEDSLRQADLVKMLEADNAPKDHVEAVRSEIGCARVRPEEVAGASLEEAWPVTFEVCERNGREITAKLDARYQAKK